MLASQTRYRPLRRTGKASSLAVLKRATSKGGPTCLPVRPVINNLFPPSASSPIYLAPSPLHSTLRCTSFPSGPERRVGSATYTTIRAPSRRRRRLRGRTNEQTRLQSQSFPSSLAGWLRPTDRPTDRQMFKVLAGGRTDGRTRITRTIRTRIFIACLMRRLLRPFWLLLNEIFICMPGSLALDRSSKLVIETGRLQRILQLDICQGPDSQRLKIGEEGVLHMEFQMGGKVTTLQSFRFTGHGTKGMFESLSSRYSDNAQPPFRLSSFRGK